jgi:hypothetical protein
VSRSLAARTGASAPLPPHLAPEAGPTGPGPTGSTSVAPPPPVRHCWVLGTSGGRAPGLLVEWRRSAGWEGRVAYVVDDGGEATLVEAWVPAEQLERREQP